MGFFSSVTSVSLDKTLTTKDKLLADIELQKEAVRAKIDGKPFNPNGSQRAFSGWFFQRQGAWWTHLRAGHTLILINGGDAFQAGDTLHDLIAWFEGAQAAIRTGELDSEIEEARKRRTRS